MKKYQRTYSIERLCTDVIITNKLHSKSLIILLLCTTKPVTSNQFQTCKLFNNVRKNTTSNFKNCRANLIF